MTCFVSRWLHAETTKTKRGFVLCLTTLALFWIAPATASAMSAMILFDCEEFGSGCENRIPEEPTETRGKMKPSSIIVPKPQPECEGVYDLDVYVNIYHHHRGSLDVFLTHVPSETTIVLISGLNSDESHIDVTLDDEAANYILNSGCSRPNSECRGTFQPVGTLSDFDLLDPGGEWQLKINDRLSNDSGMLVSWSLNFTFPDEDGDEIPDCYDPCPDDSNLLDRDDDGVADCLDGCPDDPDKSEPGVCGCGNPELDLDDNGICDTDEECVGDPNSGDRDNDGVCDDQDGCPDNPDKIDPGACGCDEPDTDSDGDGRPDCRDPCPDDPNKISPGLCGCGVPDIDLDGNGVCDIDQGCDGDPNVGDRDNDGVCDDEDGCPDNPDKTDPGACGCDEPDTDSDGDGRPDCRDPCPDDPNKISPGLCGCGEVDVDLNDDGVCDADQGCGGNPNGDDRDDDGVCDDQDGCPDDPDKIDPGVCGCDVVDDDSDGDGIADCIDNCPNVPNPDQADSNSDGNGDACTAPPAGEPCASGTGMTAMPMTILGLGCFRRRKRISPSVRAKR